MNNLIKKCIALGMAAVTFCAFTGCDKPQPDEALTTDQVNSSAEYCARGFIESIFYDNEEMFDAVFPNSTVEMLSESYGKDIFEVYKTSFEQVGEFYGTGVDSTKDYSEDDGLDVDALKSDISGCQDIDEDLISDINIIGLSCYFKIDGKDMSTTVYTVVYEADGNWYFYELQNATDDE